jgi:hypothetical protein
MQVQRGRPQSAVLGTAAAFDPITVANIVHKPDNKPDNKHKFAFPLEDGTLQPEGTDDKPQAKRTRYGESWVLEEQRRERLLRSTPEYRFMLKVEGTTTPLLTQKHLNSDFADVRKTLDAARVRSEKSEDKIRELKTQLMTQLIPNIANHQKIGMSLVHTSDGDKIQVATSDAASANAPGNAIDAALFKMQNPGREPIGLDSFFQNINAAIDSTLNSQLTASPEYGEEQSMMWAMLPQHSGVFNYTPIYQQGLCLACAKLEDIVGVLWTPEELVLKGQGPGASASDENLNTLLAQLVGYEILDNDTMVTRRYSTQFQAKDLKQKRAMLIMNLKRRLGGEETQWTSLATGHNGMPWGSGMMRMG